VVKELQEDWSGDCTVDEVRRKSAATFCRGVRKKRSCTTWLCAPGCVSQVVIVAWRWPNTRTAADTLNPSARAVSTSATRWEAVLSL
jgi:hypothetical protein